MARKTHYIDRLGIRVEGLPNATEAKRAWEARRDHWVDVSTGCPPYVLAFRGFTLIVAPKPGPDNWEYTVVTPQYSGVRHASCYFGAPSQIAAIAVGLGAMAQAMWSRDIPDDAEFFTELVTVARVSLHEARAEYDNFRYATAFWRAHPIATAA